MFDFLKIDTDYKLNKRVDLNRFIFKIKNKKKNKHIKNSYQSKNRSNKSLCIIKQEQRVRLYDFLKKNDITNRRIFNEVFKTIKTSDIICLVLDVRDPIGTWNILLTNKVDSSKKNLIVILNKIDLVPTWVTSNWLKIFSKNYLVAAFHCSNNETFGKNILLKIIKIIRKENFVKQRITIGVIGYPNVGKSTLINELKGKLVTKTSPISGCSKVWQIIKLSKKIFIIDTPGITNKSIWSCSSCILKRNVIYSKNKKDNNYFIFLAKRIVGIYSGESKNNNLVNEERTIKLEKHGMVDKINRKTVFVCNFLSGNIPWFAPLPMFAQKKVSFYILPWTSSLIL
nr:GTP-binding protein [Cryptomonas curvata]